MLHAQLLSLLEDGSHSGICISRGKILDWCLVQMLGGARSGSLMTQHPVVELDRRGRIFLIVDQEAIIIGVHLTKRAGAGGALASRHEAHLD